MLVRIVLGALATCALAGWVGADDPPTPLVKLPGLEAGGWPVQESGPTGLGVRYLPGRRFAIGFELQNAGGARVVVEDVRSEDPEDSLVHHVGTRLVRLEPPRSCSGFACPLRVFVKEPYQAGPPEPQALDPGDRVGVQVNYAVAGCGALPHGTTATAHRLVVRYRVGSGGSRESAFPVGALKLRLREPELWLCDSSRRSRLVVTGRFSASSESRVASSDGDVCVVGRSELRFRSRSYAHSQDSKPAVRVVLRAGTHVGTVHQRAGRRPLVIVWSASGRTAGRSSRRAGQS